MIETQAAYLQGWLKTIKGDKKLVIAAAGAAQRSADWIFGERPYGLPAAAAQSECEPAIE